MLRNPTISERRAIVTRLGAKFDRYESMTDAELLAEFRQIFSAVTEATRHQCIKGLVMYHCDELIQTSRKSRI